MTPRRVWTSTARRPYADEQMLAWAFAIALTASAVLFTWFGYLIGTSR